MNHLAKPASPVGDETKLAALRRDFSLPARQLLSRAQADALRRAHQFTQPHEEGNLACWRFGDQERLIVLVHGWSGRGTDLLPFVPPLRAAGFSVVLFDLPAHGDSSGSVASPVHARRALLTMCKALGEVHGLVAHSVGSAAALWTFRERVRVRASVHLSGPFSMAAQLRRMSAACGLGEQATKAFFVWVEGLTSEPIATRDLDVLLPSLPHRGLIFHAPEDRVVPFAASQRLHDVWPGSELVPCSGLGHRRLLDDVGIVSRSVDFLAASLREQRDGASK